MMEGKRTLVLLNLEGFFYFDLHIPAKVCGRLDINHNLFTTLSLSLISHENRKSS